MSCLRAVQSACLALLTASALTGCAGGPIAQQIASSIATRVADKVVGDMVDAELRREREPVNIVLRDTEPDPYYAKFLLTQFPDAPKTEMIVEPLPSHVELEQGRTSVPANRLVTVEILNLIIGKEKQLALERSLLNGSTVLPTPVEWRDWQLAAGTLPGHADSQLYFLIPPDFGRISSGERAIVEIAGTGGIHIARYRAN